MLSTYKTFLMVKESSTYAKVIDIKEYPDLGGDPTQIDVTTLSHRAKINIPGTEDLENLPFLANYTKTDYESVKALEGVEKEYAVWFGATEAGGVLTPTGSDGKFEFKGILNAYPTGGGVDDPRNIQINISPTTPISLGSA